MTRIRNKKRSDNDKIFCIIDGNKLVFRYQRARTTQKVYLFEKQTTEDALITYFKNSWHSVTSNEFSGDVLCLYVCELYQSCRHRNSRLVSLYEKIARMAEYILTHDDDNDSTVEPTRSTQKCLRSYHRQKTNYTYADDDWAA